MESTKRRLRFLNQVFTAFISSYKILLEIKKSGIESRAAMSLIATCKYQMDEFPAAAAYYQKLIQLAKDNDDYKFNLAMCLYKSGDYSAALKVIFVQ